MILAIFHHFNEKREKAEFLLTKIFHIFQLSKLMSEKSDAEEHLEDVLVVVQLLSNEISMSDNLRPQLDTILSRIPLEIMEKVNQQNIYLQ